MKKKSRYIISDRNGNDVFVGNMEECAEFIGYKKKQQVSQLASRQKCNPGKKAYKYYARLYEG